MILRKWDKLPKELKTEEVRPYYGALSGKTMSLLFKRILDFCVALLLLIILSPVFLVLAILIATDSPGGVFFRQERVTTYGKRFKIHKFRTMVVDAEKKGTQITIRNDARITKVGALLRKNRLDELPQLLDVLSGNMSFVGTRPEVPKYVDKYTNEMMATLLLPAGITSEASIRFKGEAKILAKAEDVDQVYINEILPQKMKHNLNSIKNFGFWRDIATMFRTVLAVLGKDYPNEV